MGFTLQTFTLFHVLVSLVGIITGLVVAGGLAGGRRLPGWGAVFLITTVLTSATGFGFPSDALLPSHIVGGISLVVLVVVVAAQIRGLTRIYAVGVVIATYLNSFVLVVQLFRRIPDLAALAPTQSEPPFAIAQALVLASFISLGIAANAGGRSTATNLR